MGPEYRILGRHRMLQFTPDTPVDRRIQILAEVRGADATALQKTMDKLNLFLRKGAVPTDIKTRNLGAYFKGKFRKAGAPESHVSGLMTTAISEFIGQKYPKASAEEREEIRKDIVVRLQNPTPH